MQPIPYIHIYIKRKIWSDKSSLFLIGMDLAVHLGATNFANISGSMTLSSKNLHFWLVYWAALCSSILISASFIIPPLLSRKSPCNWSRPIAVDSKKLTLGANLNEKLGYLSYSLPSSASLEMREITKLVMALLRRLEDDNCENSMTLAINSDFYTNKSCFFCIFSDHVYLFLAGDN